MSLKLRGSSDRYIVTP